MESIKIAFLHPREPIIIGRPKEIKEYLEKFFEAKLKEITKYVEDDDVLSFEKEELEKTLTRAKNAIDEIEEGDYFGYEFNLSTDMYDREVVLQLHLVKEI